ncbi:MAG: aminotransferase class V-fold PLP-dependent enzyme [Chloroflexi bacterium]|nr:aminotransferase class V-fold PLP-dependent enzyme [Chloroflexota bacterium]
MSDAPRRLPPDLAYDAAADARHQELRGQFLLRPDVTFLNHGSFGACPRSVFERYQAWQLELEQQPVEFIGRRATALMAEARAALAAYLGADADEVVYFQNVTAALNVVARSLPLRAGDEILTTNHEYGALDRTWTFVCQKTGARYVNQPLPSRLDDPHDVVEAVWSGVTPRTRVLFLSHITSPTALILPVAELIARVRAAGIWTVIDGAHAPGQVDLDLHALGADFYGGNCHKWLCAPKGAGFLYAQRDVQHLLEPQIVSWGWQARDPSGSRFVDEQEYQGTRDISAFLTVPAAIEFLQANDWPRVRAECHQLVRMAREEIAEITGLPPLTPDSPAWFAQLGAIPLPPGDEKAFKARLYDEYRVEAPIVAWAGQRFVRVSAQGYTTQADIERLTRAVGEILASER